MRDCVVYEGLCSFQYLQPSAAKVCNITWPLQCVAVCCSVLQGVAVRCSALQCVKCVAVCCSMLQCRPQRCAISPGLDSSSSASYHTSVLQCVAACCTVLQCVALCCSVLQCVAVFCSSASYHILHPTCKHSRIYIFDTTKCTVCNETVY